MHAWTALESTFHDTHVRPHHDLGPHAHTEANAPNMPSPSGSRLTMMSTESVTACK